MSLPQVDNFVNLATRVYAFMRIQTELSPRNNALNSLLTVLFKETLKRRCVQEVNAILNSPQLHAIAPGLRTLLGEAEYEMERYCPAAIVGDVTGGIPYLDTRHLTISFIEPDIRL
jgi:hypothetical protein